MASDYSTHEIANWETINGTMVPLDKWGHYLNWNTVSEDKGTAQALTDPYGTRNFAVGNSEGDKECKGDWTVFFDFDELPDGRIVLHAVVNSESGGFIEDFDYKVVARINAADMAKDMVYAALEGVAENNVRHDTEGWNQSPCYFWRSVHCFVAKNGPAIRIPVKMKYRGINTRNYF